MSVFEKEVLSPVRQAMDGGVPVIPLHLERFNDHVSIRKAIYTLLGGNTGSGKTAFVDDAYVLSPYSWWLDKAIKKETDISFRVLYRSMERKKSLKLAKWACWKLYHDHKLLIDAETLLGYKKTKISDDTWRKLVACRDWADQMLDYVEIIDGRVDPAELESWIYQYALKHGQLFEADDLGVYQHPITNPKKYIANFDLNTAGKSVKSISLKVGERVISLAPGEKAYVENNPLLFTNIIADHVGKFKPAPGDKAGKPTVDRASGVLSDSRDIYSFSPVAISQFNRSISDTQRMKFANGDLVPIIEDFKESGNTQEDADLILALFNPLRYKAFDDSGMYKGYNIKNRMVSPQGHNRYRLMSILKNSYGMDDIEVGMKFLGEIGGFSTLPKPTDSSMAAAYAEIAAGR